MAGQHPAPAVSPNLRNEREKTDLLYSRFHTVRPSDSVCLARAGSGVAQWAFAEQMALTSLRVHSENESLSLVSSSSATYVGVSLCQNKYVFFS